jgi:hypothetical protein
MPFAYVIPQWHKDAAVKTIKEYLQQHEIYTVGRFGEWAYYNTDHAILSGKRAAEQIKEKKLRHLSVSAPVTRGTPAGSRAGRTAVISAGEAPGAAGKVQA